MSCSTTWPARPGKVYLVDLSPYAAADALPQTGTQWRVERARLTFLSDVPIGSINATVRVKGREKVRVPAGELDAIRVEATTTELWSQGGIRTYLILNYWYSVTDRRLVKASRQQISNHTNFNTEDTLELERRETAASMESDAR